MNLVVTALLATVPGWGALVLVVESGPRGWVPMSLAIACLLVLARHAPTGRRVACALGFSYPLALLVPAGTGGALFAVLLSVELFHAGTRVMPFRSAAGRTLSGAMLALPLLALVLYLGGFSSHTLPGGKVAAMLTGALLAGIGSALGEWWVLRSPALRHALERS